MRGPIELKVFFYIERVKSRTYYINDRIPHAVDGGPDDDNLYKTVKDSLQEGKFLADDGYVCASTLRKYWVEVYKFPRIEVQLSEFEDDDIQLT